MAPIIRPAGTCQTCKFAASESEGKWLSCRLNPPIPFPIIVADAQGKPAVYQWVASPPPVSPDAWCSHHKPKLVFGQEAVG